MKLTSTILLLFGLNISLCFGENDYTNHSNSSTNCTLIEKPFIKKNGIPSGEMELYLICPMQEYFVKVCESNVLYDELVPFINQSINVDIEILTGDWDICYDDPDDIQTRTGQYVIITALHR